MLQVLGGVRHETGGGTAPRGKAINFEVPDALIEAWAGLGVADPDAALRVACPPDMPDGEMLFDDYLKPADAAMLRGPAETFQGALAAALREHAGRDVYRTIADVVALPVAQSAVAPLQVPIDGETAPMVVPTVAFRFFLVPDSFQYVLSVFVRVAEIPTQHAAVPLPPPDDYAPLVLLISTAGAKKGEKRARPATFA